MMDIKFVEPLCNIWAKSTVAGLIQCVSSQKQGGGMKPWSCQLRLRLVIGMTVTDTLTPAL